MQGTYGCLQVYNIYIYIYMYVCVCNNKLKINKQAKQDNKHEYKRPRRAVVTGQAHTCVSLTNESIAALNSGGSLF